jgi:shikimate kinase / 3-dehydroquinate synthase
MIVLIGFMGAGKTSVGRALASVARLPFVDIDEEVERISGRSIPEIFASDGEPEFRALERDAIARALDGSPSVIAVGGGAIGDPRTRTDLEWHEVVHLDVGFREALRRIDDTESRPMLATRDPKELYDERQRLYERLARVTVATDGKRPEEVAMEVAERLGLDADPTLRRIPVRVPDPYDVVIGSGLLERLDDFLPDTQGVEAAFVVTHPSLDKLARPVVASLEKRGLKVHTIEVEEGESAKSIERAGELYGRLAQAPAHRHDLVVAVGGGVIGDLASFVASTYNRGMPVILVPTTLLAQVDAAVGGKTGVNLPSGKNLVGTIHQPRLVVCDVQVLASLPQDEFVSGLAEVAKYGFIHDPDIHDLLSARSEELWARDPELLREIVARSVAIKAAIVAIDEKETGLREILNYGHTFAHAIEQSEGFTLRHGHAVALGMMAAAYLAQELRRIEPEVVDRHREVLEALNLPVRAALDLDALERAWVRDKKYRGGVRFVLLSGLGRAEIGVTAPRPAIARALERMES